MLTTAGYVAAKVVQQPFLEIGVLIDYQKAECSLGKLLILHSFDYRNS